MKISSLAKQRASIGLSTPTQAEREEIWRSVSVPQAQLRMEDGGFRPHRILKRLHNGPWRFVAEGGGLRGGKSLGSSIGEALPWMPHSQLIWLAAETYDLCRQEFEYIEEGSASLGWDFNVSKPKNKYQPCSLETEWGCLVETRSLHDLGDGGQGTSLVARAPDLIIVCEPGFAPMGTWQQARERLSTRRGRLWMAGTFENANTWFVDLWRKWARWPNKDMGKSLSVPSWLNTASFPGGRHDPEIESIERMYPTMRQFLVRWGGVPMQSEALVMGDYWNAKTMLEPVLYTPKDREGFRVPVELAIDPGYTGTSRYVVLVLQRVGKEVMVIDEVSATTLVHEEVIDLCRMRPWWGNVTRAVIDPYAGVNHYVGAVSPMDIWWRYGKIPTEPAIRLEVEEALGRVQLVMRDPLNGRSRLHVNPAAERLRWEMDHWRRKLTRDGFGKPSDVNCDAIKALAYWCSSRYTEDALTGIAAQSKITVSDFMFGGNERTQLWPNSTEI